jgi:TP901 family phage tail tape measure protein
MADVADLRVKYSADTRDFDAGAERVDKGIKGFIKQAGAFAAGDLLASGIRAIGGAAVGAAGSLAGMAMDAADLDSKISGIVALAGGGAEDFDRLGEAINGLAINPNLIVEADEAATVMQNLIANGLTLQDVYNGAAEATVLLANATGGSFEDAATIATDTMAILGVEAENMLTAVDGITRVTNASKLSLQDYGYAIAQSAAQAQSAGVELDDYNTGLVAINNNFSGGSDLGTGLRNFYTRLVPSTAPAIEAMKEIGLMTTDYAGAAERLGDILGYDVAPNQYAVVEAFQDMAKAQGIDIKNVKQLDKAWDAFADDFDVNAFYDADGLLKSSDEIAGALNAALAPLNEMDKSRILNEIFGADAARAALGFAEYTAEEFRALSTEINGLAGAQENAQIRNNNLKGDMMAFGGVLDAVKLKIGKEFQPALRTLFQSGTGLLTELEPSLTGIADVLANSLERATPRIVSVTEAIVKTASDAIQNGFGSIFEISADGSSGIGNLAIALGANEAAVNSFGAALLRLGDAYRSGGLSELFATSIGGIAVALGADEAAVRSFGESLANLKSAFDAGGFRGLFDEAFANVDISTALDGLRTKLSDAFANFEFSTTIQTAKGQVNGFRDGILTNITETINGINWETVSLSFAGLVDSVTAGIADVDWSTITWTDVATKIVGFLSPGLGLALKTASWVISSDSFSGVVTAVTTALSGITWGDISTSFTKLGDAITTGIGKIDTTTLTALFPATDLSTASTNLGNVATALSSVYTNLSSFATITNLDGAGAAIGRIIAQLGSASEISKSAGYFNELSASLRQLDQAGKGAFTGANAGAASYFDKLSASMKQLDASGKGLGTTFNEALTWDFSSVDKAFNSFTKADSALKAIGTALTNIKNAAKDAFTWDFAAVDEAFNTKLSSAGAKTMEIAVTVGEVIWGEFTNIYNVAAKVAKDVLWGPWTNVYAVGAEVLTDVIWGTWTWIYSVGAAVNGPGDVAWGTWTHIYNVTASIVDWIIGSPPVVNVKANLDYAATGINEAMNVRPNGSNSAAESFVDSVYNLVPGWSDGPTAPRYPTGNGGRSNGMMPAFAGAGGGGGVTIIIQGYNQDEESLARRIAAIIQRRG